MKSFSSLAALIGFVLMAQAATASPLCQDAVKTNDQGKVTITSKGRDVREVLYDLFVQKKKNFVVEGVEKVELFLNLTDISFDEALEIVMKQAGLKYDLQSDIYYLSKKSKMAAPAVADPIKPSPAGTTGTTPTMTPIENRLDPQSKPPVIGTPPPVTLKAPTPTQLTDADLRKRLTTRFNLVDIRDLFADFARQTGVKIEVAADVPAYKVKAFLIDTSLKFAMDTVTKKAKLKYAKTDNQSLMVSKA